jgi:GNAT superfamily N-acetyltransferase
MLRALTDVDQVTRVAWLAQVDGRPVGIGSYVVLEGDPTTADLALAVVDRHQRAGIGRRLLTVLRDVAAGHGVRTFVFTVHPGNRGAQALLRTAGGAASFHDGVLEGQLPVR